ncbi:MAG: hypothetical protein ACRDMV_08885 [Streptosporangiales bacterium]
MEYVKIYHPKLDRTVEVPAQSVASWTQQPKPGWQRVDEKSRPASKPAEKPAADKKEQ